MRILVNVGKSLIVFWKKKKKKGMGSKMLITEKLTLENWVVLKIRQFDNNGEAYFETKQFKVDKLPKVDYVGSNIHSKFNIPEMGAFSLLHSALDMELTEEKIIQKLSLYLV